MVYPERNAAAAGQEGQVLNAAVSPSLAEDGRVLRRGASRSLHPLSSVPRFLLTFSLRMERMTLMMLTLVSGTLHGKRQRRHSNVRRRPVANYKGSFLKPPPPS